MSYHAVFVKIDHAYITVAVIVINVIGAVFAVSASLSVHFKASFRSPFVRLVQNLRNAVRRSSFFD